MVERWIPVVAAILGVAGGMGGAYVGGYVANQGQQQRLEAERVAHMQDVRRQTYMTFLEKLETQYREGGEVTKLWGKQASVLLMSTIPGMREASAAVIDAAGESGGGYIRAREELIQLLQQQLNQDG